MHANTIQAYGGTQLIRSQKKPDLNQVRLFADE
ncbi:hypothetical protein M2103_002317 [Ereboglobus sp. PH5-5]|nr:hypothetical protein [Ereboglobus sp. PH5-5]